MQRKILVFGARDAVSGAAALSWISLALSRSVVRRALGYGLVVGSVLIGINHGDALLRGDVDATRLLKMTLTPLVPYCVSTLSSVGALRSRGGGAACREEVGEDPG
jgi:hypothetical protein